MIKSQSSFKDYLQTSASDIEMELQRLAKAWNNNVINEFTEIYELNKRFTQSWFGGKMLRGTLVKLGYELVDKKKTRAILQPAVAFEILHTALLIHDDIIDQSLVRRGKPAMHMHKDAHFGISQAICLGDIGISMSGKLIAESDFPHERKNRALSYFFEMVNQTGLGEMMDVASTQAIKRTEKQILQIHKMKTAHYTFVGPLTLGAILAGADDEILIKIKKFAEPLGIAYQIQDDILGIFGEEKTLGKSTTSDIEENKSTLLIAYALKKGRKQQQIILKNLYGKKTITKEEQEMIKKIFVETGSLTYSQTQIAKLTTEAKKQLFLLSSNERTQKLLNQLADSLSIRTN